MRSDVHEHIVRRHLSDVMTHDAQSNYEAKLLSGLLDVVEMALQDENLTPQIIHRVLQKIIYGAMPTPAQVHSRIQVMQLAVDAKMHSTAPNILSEVMELTQ